MTSPGRSPWVARMATEFALIIVGVLVAFSLEGWWSARRDRQAELQYISDLHDELVSNTESFTNVERLHEGAVASLRNALQLIPTGISPDAAQEFVIDLVRGGTFETVPQFNRSVFEDLQNSGRLQLVRDDGLRRAIMDHYGGLEATLVRLRGAQEQIESGLPSLLAGHLPPDLVTWGARPSDVRPGPAGTREVFYAVAHALVADPDLVAEVQVHLVAFQLEGLRLARFHRVFDTYRSVLDTVFVES